MEKGCRGAAAFLLAKNSVLSPSVILGLRLALQQSTDRQGYLFVLLVNGDDLRIHNLALAEYIAGLLHPVVSDLGDVDQAVNAGTISANAPNVISLTMRTLATSPAVYFPVNTVQGSWL